MRHKIGGSHKSVPRGFDSHVRQQTITTQADFITRGWYQPQRLSPSITPHSYIDNVQCVLLTTVGLTTLVHIAIVVQVTCQQQYTADSSRGDYVRPTRRQFRRNLGSRESIYCIHMHVYVEKKRRAPPMPPCSLALAGLLLLVICCWCSNDCCDSSGSSVPHIFAAPQLELKYASVIVHPSGPLYSLTTLATLY